MNEETQKIKSFKDLKVWQKGHTLVVDIYKITDRFPSKEIFGLTSQLRRAAVSITSNISEGFSRRSPREKSQFYFIALGSLTELQSQILIAKDISYLNLDVYENLEKRTVEIGKMINGLLNHFKNP